MKAMRRPIVLAAVFGALIAALTGAIAVGSGGNSNAKPNARYAVGGAADSPGEAINWDAPFVDGVDVGSDSAAAAHVPFSVVRPQQIAGLAHTIIHDPGATPADHQAVAFVYRNPRFGTFRVLEEPTTQSEADLEALASGCDPANGCEGRWQVVQIGGGRSALLIAGPETTGVMWINGTRKFDVYGPASSFSEAQAESIAAAFAAAAG